MNTIMRALSSISLFVMLAHCAKHQANSSEIAILDNQVRIFSCSVEAPVKAKITLAIFDASYCSIRITSQATRENAKFLHDILKEADAIAGCNGGYFDPPHMTPSGLEICDGIANGTFGPSGGGDGGGVLCVSGGVLSITPQNAFKPGPDITQLVQCGPMLIKAGTPFTEEGPRARRTFVGTDGRGRWFLGTSTSLSLAELAKLLTFKDYIGGVSVVTAMNLDGGPSTGIAWRLSDGKIEKQKESWPVRNFVLVVPKK